MSSTPASSRLTVVDLARVATTGMRSRRMRTFLSALGITIGIGAMVGVLGLSQSSKADLNGKLARLGTNLLTVQPAEGFGQGDGNLPDTATAMIGRIGPVESTSMISTTTASVYATDVTPTYLTNGIAVFAVDEALLAVLRGRTAQGVWFDRAGDSLPTVVLGSVAAERLGVRAVTGDERVWLGGRWFSVVGVLEPFDLAPDLDRSALLGQPAAATYLGHENRPTRVLVRTAPSAIDQVTGVLANTANPRFPAEVEVIRPTDALAAQAAADDTLTALFLGLGAVALLVGGVGIANVMVIAVIERRAEIGLRRALGATRRHIALQFSGEAMLLGAIGGTAGVALGAGVTAAYAELKGWSTEVPPLVMIGGIAVAIATSAIAGLYPAIRAARLSPTAALKSP